MSPGTSGSTRKTGYDLERFARAQEPIFEAVRSELGEGAKAGHWMWFIFPQIRGLGRSQMSVEFGISSLEEARAYLAHPILGPRLRECTRLVLSVKGSSITEIFGYPDEMKFRSSMTLFARATSEDEVFAEALQKYFSGIPDKLTLELLENG